METQLTHEEFSRHLHTTFRLNPQPDLVIDLELAEVSEFRQSEVQERFSMLFRGDILVPQGTYRLKHDAMGEFDIFIVPIRQTAQGYDYEAVFNRLRAPQNE